MTRYKAKLSAAGKAKNSYPGNWPTKPKWQADSVCHSLLKSVILHKYLLMEKSDKKKAVGKRIVEEELKREIERQKEIFQIQQGEI